MKSRLSIAWAILVVCSPLVTNAQMQYPLSVVATDGGELYIADRELPGIWRVDTAGVVSSFFQGSKKFRTPLNAVRCVAIDRSGALLAGDSSTREVYRFDKDAKPVPLTNGGIGIPMSIAVNSRGELLVSDLETQRIVKVPAQGGKPEVVAQVAAPRGVCVDAEDRVWVVSQNRLVRINADSKVETILEGRPFEFGHTVAVTADKTAYVVDGYAATVWKIPAGQKPEKWVSGKPLQRPVGLALSKGQLFVADPHAKAVFQIDLAGKLKPLELQAAK